MVQEEKLCHDVGVEGQWCRKKSYVMMLVLLLLARLINRQDVVFRGFGRRNP